MLKVKDWFADKKCNELKRNMSDAKVEYVLKESEKAMYVMVAGENLTPMTFWAPKSCIEEVDADRETKMVIGMEYEEVKEMFKAEMNGYR